MSSEKRQVMVEKSVEKPDQFQKSSNFQGPRNSIISGEAAQVKELTRAGNFKKLLSQPLKSGEADASPVPRPLTTRILIS